MTGRRQSIVALFIRFRMVGFDRFRMVAHASTEVSVRFSPEVIVTGRRTPWLGENRSIETGFPQTR